jgi:hypothetical protein
MLLAWFGCLPLSDSKTAPKIPRKRLNLVVVVIMRMVVVIVRMAMLDFLVRCFANRFHLDIEVECFAGEGVIHVYRYLIAFYFVDADCDHVAIVILALQLHTWLNRDIAELFGIYLLN